MARRRWFISAIPAAAMLIAGGAFAQDAKDQANVDAKPPIFEPSPPAGNEAGAAEQRAAHPGEFLTIGDAAPPLAISHWLKGREVKALDADRIYVINFWATWCKHCHKSLPELSRLQNDFRPYDVSVIAVSDEKLQTVFNLMLRPGWNEKIQYAVATDPDRSTQKDYMVEAGVGDIPTTFIIGADGAIEWIGHPRDAYGVVRQIVDGVWDRSAFRDEFETAMQPCYERARHVRKMREAYHAADWPRMMELFDEAIAHVAKPGELKVQKFLLMIGEMEAPTEGYAFGRELLEEYADDANVLNTLAWFVVDAESVRQRDLDFAMHAAGRAAELSEYENAAILDTLARVHYELGDLEAALKWQRLAVEKLDPLDPVADLVEAALEQYEREDRRSKRPQ